VIPGAIRRDQPPALTVAHVFSHAVFSAVVNGGGW
jgi:hypothetical protein